MSDADKNNLISQFAGVTGADVERAQFYLEAAAWKLDVALESFYDQGDDVDPIADVPTAQSASVAPPAATKDARPSKTSSQTQSRFATLSSMRSDDDSDSDTDREAYYAGGSERGGGQQILDPRKKKKKENTDSVVQDMFKAAKEHGAEELGGDEPSASRPKPKNRFQGTAYRLGETEEPSISIPGMSVASSPRQIDMVLKLWKDGFSVDDGPIREYNDPSNQDFLAAIKKGEVPKELVSKAKGGEVNLNMEDHRTEDYVKAKVAVKAFGGEGHRLGSPATTVVLNSAVAAAPPSQHTAQATVSLDDSQPITSLQIRLSDGTRLVAKFNHTHKVSDIRNYINNARAQGATNYVLMTTFPNKELTDESQTIAAAQLLNAVLVQRIK